MTRAICCFALCAIIGGAAVRAAGVDAKTIQAVRAVGTRVIAEGHTPGLAIGIMQAGKIVFEEGFGTAEVQHGVAVKTQTVFRIASITKQFTAAGILLLAQDGRLSTDDILTKFVPDFPRANEIRIRDLLSHAAGLASYDEKADFGTFAALPHSTSDMVDWIKGDPFLSDPGTGFHYSNSGYLLLRAVIERASGIGFSEFLQRRVFDKLGMTKTRVLTNAADVIPNFASGYLLRDGKSREWLNRPFRDPSAGGGGASMVSTVRDLLQWHQALFHDQVLGRNAFIEMTFPATFRDRSPIIPDILRALYPNSRYGYGLVLIDFKGHRKIGHTGTTAGFQSVIFTYPDDALTIVVLNNGDAAAPPIEYEIANLILGQRN